MIVYKITNKLNNKTYIGADSSGEHLRWQVHQAYGSGRWKLQKKTLVRLYRAMLYDGIENFEYEVLENCSSEEHMFEREIYWIEYFDALGENGYNCTKGGDGGDIFSCLSPEKQAERGKIIGRKVAESWSGLSEEEKSLRRMATGEASRKAWRSLTAEERDANVQRLRDDYRRWVDNWTEDERAEFADKVRCSRSSEDRSKTSAKMHARRTATEKKAIAEKQRETQLARNATPEGQDAHRRKAETYKKYYAGLSEDIKQKKAEENRAKAKKFWENISPEQREAIAQKRKETRLAKISSRQK